MKLIDCVSQYRRPFVVVDNADGQLTELSNTASFAEQVIRCPLRYVLSDQLTRLCADLAYSKGAHCVTYADLLHVPAETLWVEWCNRPWQQALQDYGFPLVDHGCQWTGRRGALIRATRDGRRGLLRTFWTEDEDQEVLASSMEAYFDFDTPLGEAPEAPDDREGEAGCVVDSARGGQDVLGRCFRFRYERSWAAYYGRASMSEPQRNHLWRHSLGTVAMDVPMLLAFFLLLATRSGLPQEQCKLDKLNRQRTRLGKAPLLDHIEVRAPMLPTSPAYEGAEWGHRIRRHPRLHHVRGHLVRRGSRIFWRLPHLRGRARAGTIHTRTVVWSFDGAAADDGAGS